MALRDGNRRRRALLIGCGTFDDDGFAALRSPPHDVAALSKALQDPAVGGYEVTEVVHPSFAEARRAIGRFLKEAQSSDALHLLYLSSHGVRDAHGHLHLACKDTEEGLEDADGLEAEWVLQQIYKSVSRSTVLLVDCCFSAAILKGMRAGSAAGPDVAEGTGVAVLTASGTTGFSFEDTEAAVPGPSYFAEAVVAGLTTGAADLDGDGRITVDELYRFVYERFVAGPSKQRPHMSSNGQGALVIAEAEPSGQLVRVSGGAAGEHCRVLLEHYANSVEGVTCVALMRRDGSPQVVFGDMRREEAERFAAMLPMLAFTISRVAVHAGVSRPFEHCAVELDGSGMLVVAPVGVEAVLGVVLRGAGPLASELVKELVKELDAALAGRRSGRLPLVDCIGPFNA